METFQAFTVLGINPASSLKLAKRLAVASIKHTVDIKRARLGHVAGPTTAVQADNGGSSPSPDASMDTAPARWQHTSDTAGPSQRPSPDESPGANTPTDPASTVLPTTENEAVPTRDGEQSHMSAVDADQWQVVTRPRCRMRSPHVHDIAAGQDVEALASRLPDRACKRARGFYAILATLSDDYDTAPPAKPIVQRGLKRCRQPELPPAPPAVAPDSPAGSVPAEQPTTHRDEASSLPQLCLTADPVLGSVAADRLHDTGPQVCAVTAPGRRKKKLKTVQVTTRIAAPPLDPPPCRRQSLPSCVKRKSDSQSVAPAVRRSTRQRIACKAFDPSDPTAKAGYVQKRGASPDEQSSLPFDPG